jgi:mannose-1-phosphate guanylyltransferase/mannose-6-phosphate isomerase
VVVEPVGRDTAPAILTAALMLEDTPEALILVAPSDHVIGDVEAFRGAVLRGAEAARTGAFVTFGAAPDRPETGYGYLQLDGTPENGAAVPLKSFREKPDLEDRGGDARPGGYLWNAGIFLMRVGDLIAGLRDPCARPGRPLPVRHRHGADRSGLLPPRRRGLWPARAISFDYAIMEKADRVMAVPLTSGWSDLGAWDALWQEAGPDADGNALKGAAHALDCRDSYLRSEDDTIRSWAWAWRGWSPWRCAMRSWWPTSPAPRT